MDDTVRIPYFRNIAMLAKPTAKHQLTRPKAVTQAVGPAESFEVEAQDSRIILTPVRIRRGDAVRAKLTELQPTERDVAAAMAWAEVVSVPESPPPVPSCRDPHDLPFLHLAAEPAAPRRW